MKTRARHEVTVCIDDGRLLLGVLAQEGVAAWNETALQLGQDGLHALLKLAEKAELLQLLEDGSQMAEAAREIAAECKASQYLLVYPDLGDGSSEANFWRDRSTCFPSGVLRYTGVNFPAIRATVAAIHYQQGRSAAAISGYLGNGVRVAWGHYIPRPNSGLVAQEAAVFFQRLMQSLLLSRTPEPAAAIGMEREEIDLVLRIARASGIAAAIGVVEATEFTPRPTLRFYPTVC